MRSFDFVDRMEFHKTGKDVLWLWYGEPSFRYVNLKNRK